MTDRKTASTINDAELDALYDQLAALRQIARGYCPACGRGDAAPTVEDWERERKRAEQAEAALDRVRQLAERWRYTADRKHSALPELRAALDQPAPGPDTTSPATRHVHVTITNPDPYTANRAALSLVDWIRAEFPGMHVTTDAREWAADHSLDTDREQP